MILFPKIRENVRDFRSHSVSLFLIEWTFLVERHTRRTHTHLASAAAAAYRVRRRYVIDFFTWLNCMQISGRHYREHVATTSAALCCCCDYWRSFQRYLRSVWQRHAQPRPRMCMIIITIIIIIIIINEIYIAHVRKSQHN